MGKGVCRFREVDITRALKAAKKAGVDVQVEIDFEHKRMRIMPVRVAEANDRNEWDEELFNGNDQAAVR